MTGLAGSQDQRPSLATGSAEMVHAVSRAIQLRIFIPVLVLQVINSLDRVNISFAALHMNADLRLSRAAYGLSASIFFWGYLLFQYPSAWLLQRIGFRRWICAVMVTCGLVATATAFVQGAVALYVLRFLLGAAEGGFVPGIVGFIRRFVPARHRAMTVALTMLPVPLSVILGGPVSGWLMGHAAGGFAGWRWMFLIEAAPLVLLGIAALGYFPDSPLQAGWLSPVEKTWLQGEMAREDAVAVSASGNGGGLRAAFNWRVGLFSFVWFSSLSGAFSLIFWLPQVIKQISGLGDLSVGVISALPWVGLGAGMLFNGARSDRIGERFWHVVLPMTVAGLAIGASAGLGSGVLALLAIIVGATGIGAAQGAFWAAPTAFLKSSRAMGALVVISVTGNLGGLVTPYVVGLVRDRTGSFHLPVLVVAAILLAGALAMLPLRNDLRRLRQVDPS